MNWNDRLVYSEEQIAAANTVRSWLDKCKVSPIRHDSSLVREADGVLFGLNEGFIYIDVQPPGRNIPYVQARKETTPLRSIALTSEPIVCVAFALSIRNDATIDHLLNYGAYTLAELFRNHMQTPYGEVFVGDDQEWYVRIGPGMINPLHQFGWVGFPNGR